MTDATVLKIVVTDDGRPLPPGSDATAGGAGGHYVPSGVPHPQAQTGQRPSVTAAGPPDTGSPIRSDWTAAAASGPASTASAISDLIARRFGIDPRLLDIIRRPAHSIPSVTAAPDVVTVNEPAGGPRPTVNKPFIGPQSAPWSVPPPGLNAGMAANPGPAPPPGVTAATAGVFGPAVDYVKRLGVAGIAGVVAAGMAAISYVDSKIREIGERGRESTRAAGRVGSSIANNDAVGAVVAYSEMTASVLENAPVVGTLLGSVARSAGVLVQSFDSVARSFVDRGRELAQYNGAAAGAAARQQVRDILANIREGNALGNQFADVSDRYGELMDTIKEIFLPIKRLMLGAMASILELLNNVLTIALPFIELGTKVFEMLISILKAMGAFKLIEMIAEGVSQLAKLADAAREWLGLKAKEESPLDKFLREAEGQFERGDGRRADRGNLRNPNQPMNIGAFAGL